MTDNIEDVNVLMPEGNKGENIPQNIAEDQVAPEETVQEAPEQTESVYRIEYVDDGAEKVDAAILEALGGASEGEEVEMPENEENGENLPEAWDLPTGEKKVAVMIPRRRRADSTLQSYEEEMDIFEEEEIENGTNNSG